MNFIDFVIDCYSHITSHVSQAFASCTHYTNYSLLNFVHVIVCVYGLTNQVLQVLWILCKINLLLEKFVENARNFIFGKFGLKIFFENHIITYSCILFLNFNALSWFYFFQKTVFFLKFSEPLPISIDPFYFSINRKFLNMFERASDCFDRSKLFFDQSNFFQIVLLKPLSVSIDQGWFSIDRNSWIMFFKSHIRLFQRHFFKTFQTFLSLSDLARLH